MDLQPEPQNPRVPNGPQPLSGDSLSSLSLFQHLSSVASNIAMNPSSPLFDQAASVLGAPGLRAQVGNVIVDSAQAHFIFFDALRFASPNLKPLLIERLEKLTSSESHPFRESDALGLILSSEKDPVSIKTRVIDALRSSDPRTVEQGVQRIYTTIRNYQELGQSKYTRAEYEMNAEALIEALSRADNAAWFQTESAIYATLSLESKGHERFLTQKFVSRLDAIVRGAESGVNTQLRWGKVCGVMYRLVPEGLVGNLLDCAIEDRSRDICIHILGSIRPICMRMALSKAEAHGGVAGRLVASTVALSIGADAIPEVSAWVKENPTPRIFLGVECLLGFAERYMKPGGSGSNDRTARIVNTIIRDGGYARELLDLANATCNPNIIGIASQLIPYASALDGGTA